MDSGENTHRLLQVLVWRLSVDEEQIQSTENCSRGHFKIMFCSNPLRLFLICMCSLLHIKHCALQVNQTTQSHCIVCECICVCLILAHAQQPHPHPTPSNTAVFTEPESGCWQREAERSHEGQWGGVPVTERWRVTGWESFSWDRKIPPASESEQLTGIVPQFHRGIRNCALQIGLHTESRMPATDCSNEHLFEYLCLLNEWKPRYLQCLVSMLQLQSKVRKFANGTNRHLSRRSKTTKVWLKAHFPQKDGSCLIQCWKMKK